MKRKEFAERISAGLSGWFQQLAVQSLEHHVGEDAARVELVRMISAQQAYVPKTSMRPNNWPASTKKRIDIAVLGRQNLEAGGWYGAIELKWPNLNIDTKAVRHAIVEDAVRVVFSKTSNLCANFLVLGGANDAIKKLLDKQHKNSAKEKQRISFNKLFSRNPKSPEGSLSSKDLKAEFPNFGDRVPQEVFNGWERKLRSELVTVSESRVGSTVKGYVYVWQIRK